MTTIIVPSSCWIIDNQHVTREVYAARMAQMERERWCECGRERVSPSRVSCWYGGRVPDGMCLSDWTCPAAVGAPS